MPTVVIPFAGRDAKTRLHPSRRARADLSLAMLADVVMAASAVGEVRVVTADAAAAALVRELGGDVVADPGGGQGAAVAAALAGLDPGALLVVNADVPCAVPADLRALLAATPAGGTALVESLDGMTNALSLSATETFAPLYGRDSAARFHAHGAELGIDVVSAAIPNLAEDVDTLDDLQRLQLRCGPRTQACLTALPAGTLA